MIKQQEKCSAITLMLVGVSLAREISTTLQLAQHRQRKIQIPFSHLHLYSGVKPELLQ